MFAGFIRMQKRKERKTGKQSLLHTSSPPLLSSPHSLSLFSYLTIFPPRRGQPNTFIIFCSTNKAVHWSEVLTPHNDPLSQSHCSYTQDNYSTLQLERGNYWERCSSRVSREEKRGLGQGSCGCIVYWGRRSNKGPKLRQDPGRKMWCGDTAEAEKTSWPLGIFHSLSQNLCAVNDTFVHLSMSQSPDMWLLWVFLSGFPSGHAGYTAD